MQGLIQQILADRCESATPQDVLEYQDAVDELGRVLSNRHVAALVPAFSHRYWRVRKHAVMAAKAALSRISPPEREELVNALHAAAHDSDLNVSTMAEGFK